MSHALSQTTIDRLAMSALKEIYLSIFVLFYRISRWDGRMKAGAASLFVSGVTLLLVLALWAGLQIASHQHISLNRWVVGGGSAAIAMLNDYFLVVQGCGATFDKQFRHFGKRKQVTLSVIAIGSVVMTVIAFFLLVANYHQAFNLPHK